ncbi:hypothetical protein GGF46_003168 [Coemansia sp. RSA 552]|nr:hypothetical protein GGF46_003168 [Coemansia sp. RSA 552]
MASSADAFRAFDAYDFDGDESFQAGLRTLPESDSPSRLLKAKAFYYSRAVAPVDLEEYQAWKSTRSTQGEQDAADDMGPAGAPYSASFAQVMGKIMRGEEIEGIRDIPDKLNDQPPSTSTAKVPPKPWERHGE